MGLIKITNVEKHENYSTFDAFKTEGRSVRVGKVLFGGGARVPEDGYTAHAAEEYVCILKGTIAFGTEEEEYNLNVGDFHYMPKGKKHWCQNIESGDGELLYIMID